MAVSRRLRYEVLRRDNHTCRYCGATAPDVKLTVDHVTPKALGGKDEASNLVAACGPCNAGKTSVAPDSPVVEDVAADALRWGHARTLVLEEWRQKRRELSVELANFADAWNGWQYGPDDDRQTVPRGPGWEESVERWFHEGLTVGDLVSLIPKAMHNKPGRRGQPIAIADRWTYYCGVVWRTLDAVVDGTTRKLAEPDDEPPGSTDPGVAFRAGYVSALEWAKEYRLPAGTTPIPCLNCFEYAHGDSGYCFECWIDACDPDIDRCRACKRLFHICDVSQLDAGLPRCEPCNSSDRRSQAVDELEPF